MQKTKFKFIISLLVIFSLLFTVVYAANETNTETGTNEVVTTNEENTTTGEEQISQEDIITDNVFKYGSNVTIDQLVDGNVVITAYSTATITGKINGDVIVMADKLVISGGEIYGNLFVMAKEVVVENGLIYNLYALCDDLKCEYEGMSALDMKVFANKIDFSGYCGRNALLIANEKLNISDDSYVAGNLMYSGKNDVTISDSATIVGQKIEKDYNPIKIQANTSLIILGYVVSFIQSLILVLVIWLLLMLFTPKLLQKTENAFPKKILPYLGIGLIALIVTPIIAVLLLMIAYFAPISMILIGLYIMGMISAFALTSISIATFIKNKTNINSKNAILGFVLAVAAVIWALLQIPYVSILVSIFTILYGLGIFTANLIFRKEKKDETKLEEKVEEKTEVVKEVETVKEIDKQKEDEKKEQPKKEKKQEEKPKDDKEEK